MNNNSNKVWSEFTDPVTGNLFARVERGVVECSFGALLSVSIPAQIYDRVIKEANHLLNEEIRKVIREDGFEAAKGLSRNVKGMIRFHTMILKSLVTAVGDDVTSALTLVTINKVTDASVANKLGYGTRVAEGAWLRLKLSSFAVKAAIEAGIRLDTEAITFTRIKAGRDKTGKTNPAATRWATGVATNGEWLAAPPPPPEVTAVILRALQKEGRLDAMREANLGDISDGGDADLSKVLTTIGKAPSATAINGLKAYEEKRKALFKR